MQKITDGLRFPEGPVCLSDGSIVVVEIAGGVVTRVAPDGSKRTLAKTGGGPNGAALGPDGRLYVCNNGGFEWHEEGGLLVPGEAPRDYSGGKIEAIDLESGVIECLYDSCDGNALKGPNDLVFDAEGGFWFSDNGKRYARTMDRGGIFYAKADGSLIREHFFPFEHPNGVGLSPAGDILYFTETVTGRLFHARLSAPGKPESTFNALDPQALLYGAPGMQLFDSLAVDADGNICIGTIMNGGITVITPGGTLLEHVPLPDPFVTNICFGGEDMKTAFVTLSGTGQLIAMPWPRPGLRLNYQRECRAAVWYP